MDEEGIDLFWLSEKGVNAIFDVIDAEAIAAAGHTPGPWEIETAVKGTNWELYPAHNRYPCQQPIAQGWASDIGERHDAVAEANARLIAAAPDMLEALKEVLPVLEGLAKERHVMVGEARRGGHRDKLRAAIAKAEGGAS